MDTLKHTIKTLFEQLGLDSSDRSIAKFIEQNGRIPADIELHDATCWTRNQSLFLKQLKENDADWAPVVDELNVRLR
ncbi:MAG TPA: DUF2789 domain-containing protein [Gammaproteobacteria bacterium]|nr:hypothetical protein [Gammaproteobacteria bacterium]MEC8012055.1 DUF2789 domain-containing protein [Pseudomonadota bacterium]HBF06913.1 DUF2789 domain-containing protein [Gammaproteobacteria bacterium]HCK93246.1 DUF2789 domain-containing protein [Gammaproteobacteria bacterium]|tara:strand:- start:2931 stop:3161 length:231 start_codon:yes stop_codon:yes gene_type:complete